MAPSFPDPASPAPPFKLSEDSVRLAMDQAWRDHHHARDQTWKALQIEAALAAGIVGVHVQIEPPGATIGAALLTVVAVMFGIGISLHHRTLEIRKFDHIIKCEEALGLHEPGPISGVKLPSPIRLHDVFRLLQTNTALFILRMHFTIAAFAVLYAVFAVPGTASSALLGGVLALTAAAMAVSVIRARTAAPADTFRDSGRNRMSTGDGTRAMETEFVQLRAEILKRMEMRQQIVAITLTLAGAFLAVGVAGLDVPGRGLVVLVYPPLAAFLALGWAQNDFRIRHVAKYIRDVSEPALGGPRYERWTQEERAKIHRARWPQPASWRFLVLSHGGVFLFTQFMAFGIGLATFVPTPLGYALLLVDGAAAVVVGLVMRSAAAFTPDDAPAAAPAVNVAVQ